MPPPSETEYEAVSALILGAREHQEDAVVADFPLGCNSGVVVLSDGMGGHAAGDIASKIVMTEVYSELKFQSADPAAFSRHLPEILRNAMLSANDCVRAHIEENPEAYGMGATLVAAVLQDGRLNWVSVGDSPLYLFRDGELRQLNEDHSMAPQIDYMVETGMMAPEVGRNHPDRNALLSVLAGDEIAKVDCPAEGLALEHGDIVVVASDGLQFLENEEILAVLREHHARDGATIARVFLERLDALDDPDQDNTSIAVIKVAVPGVATVAAPVATGPAVEREPVEEPLPEPAAEAPEEAPDAIDGASWDDMTDDEDDDDVVEILPIRRAEATAPRVMPRRVKIDAEHLSARPRRAEAQQ